MRSSTLSPFRLLGLAAFVLAVVIGGMPGAVLAHEHGSDAGGTPAADCTTTTPPTCDYIYINTTHQLPPTSVTTSLTPACEMVTNSNCPGGTAATGDSSKWVMVPFKTQAEWDSFNSNHEACVSISPCYVATNVNYGPCLGSCGGTGTENLITSGSGAWYCIIKNTSTTVSITDCTSPAATQSCTTAACPPPPPPPPPVSAPSVTLSASTTSIVAGNPVTLTWTDTNSPTSCTAGNDQADPGFLGSVATASGSSKTFTPAATATYTLFCSNTGGNSPSSAVTVTVYPAVTATITASPSSITAGSGSSHLSWSGTGVGSGGSCTLSSTDGTYTGGTVAKLSGASVFPSSNTTYTFTCNDGLSGTGSSATSSATVSVTSAADCAAGTYKVPIGIGVYGSLCGTLPAGHNGDICAGTSYCVSNHWATFVTGAGGAGGAIEIPYQYVNSSGASSCATAAGPFTCP